MFRELNWLMTPGAKMASTAAVRRSQRMCESMPNRVHGEKHMLSIIGEQHPSSSFSLRRQLIPGLETPVKLSTDAVAQLSTESVDNPVQRMSDGERNVLVERSRQMGIEGFTPSRRSTLSWRLGSVVTCYGLKPLNTGLISSLCGRCLHNGEADDPKPRSLESGALIVAVIERIDRLQVKHVRCGAVLRRL